ncbi:bidirectional sugar transporter SWEET3b-like [Cryptomeria japonica]|uniref:bidirectional sugar transporter SWEET3b-like n=1 Tax=Cryptomeria japonica TaxID=3369 RepID=UPI0025AD5752|nr:bidirectional sugar transporter SWEET3b-like [Cryptomeria japonica]
MNKLIRCGAGILGGTFALLMYGAPLGIFWRVNNKKTTGEMSGVPYAIGLFNCLIYTLYGSPLISNGWENSVVMGTNALGILLQFCFCIIYLRFAPSKSKRRMGLMVGGVLVVFVSIAVTSLCGLEAAHKKVFVGTVGMVASIFLYGSPLSDIRVVYRTKSVECMSFYFLMFAFLGSLLWLVYGALSKDLLIMIPNFFGIPLASVQMIIYCTYWQNSRVRIEDVKLEAVPVLVDNTAIELPVKLPSIKLGVT